MTGSSTEGIKTVLHPVSDLERAKPVYEALLRVPPMASRLPLRDGVAEHARDGADVVVRGETGGQNGQESRSASHQAGASITAMSTTVGPKNRPARPLPGFPFVVRPDQTTGSL